MTALLLALALAAPERVVVVARKAETPGLLERIKGPLARAFHRLYEREDEDVARGNALAARNDPDGALREYDKARARRPDDPRVAYDRASVLLKMDPKAAPVAVAEASQALQNGDAALKPKASYQLALASEAMGQAEDAVRQYGATLALDPDDVDSKVNLELLLRTQEERKRQSPAGQPKEKKPGQQGGQQQPQPQQGDASKKQEQNRPDQPDKDKQQQAGDQQQQEQKQAQEQQKPVARPDKPLDRSEAQRLLDALRANEQQLQTWRFAKKKTDVRRRGDPEKDW